MGNSHPPRGDTNDHAVQIAIAEARRNKGRFLRKEKGGDTQESGMLHYLGFARVEKGAALYELCRFSSKRLEDNWHSGLLSSTKQRLPGFDSRLPQVVIATADSVWCMG